MKKYLTNREAAEAYLAGKPLEYELSGVWYQSSTFNTHNPGLDAPSQYRIAPEPIRQAVIPWSVLADDIVAVAMDGNGEWFSYTGQPKPCEDYWAHRNKYFNMGHIKFDRGTEPYWWNTLQMRPGHEVLE